MLKREQLKVRIQAGGAEQDVLKFAHQSPVLRGAREHILPQLGLELPGDLLTRQTGQGFRLEAVRRSRGDDDQRIIRLKHLIEEKVHGLVQLGHGVQDLKLHDDCALRLRSGLGGFRPRHFLFLDACLPDEVEGDDFLGHAVFEDFEVLEGQVVNKFPPSKTRTGTSTLMTPVT